MFPREDLLSSDSMTERRDKRGKKKGGKRGQREREGTASPGKRKLKVVSVSLFICLYIHVCLRM